MSNQEGEFFVVFFRQKSTGIVLPRKIRIGLSDDVLQRAEQMRQAGFTIAPEDIEVWRVLNSEGKNVFNAHHSDQIKIGQKGGEECQTAKT